MRNLLETVRERDSLDATLKAAQEQLEALGDETKKINLRREMKKVEVQFNHCVDVVHQIMESLSKPPHAQLSRGVLMEERLAQILEAVGRVCQQNDAMYVFTQPFGGNTSSELVCRALTSNDTSIGLYTEDDFSFVEEGSSPTASHQHPLVRILQDDHPDRTCVDQVWDEETDAAAELDEAFLGLALELTFEEQLRQCRFPAVEATSVYSGKPDTRTSAADQRTMREYHEGVKLATPSKTRFVTQDWRRVPAKPLFHTAVRSAPADVDALINISEQPTPLEEQFNTAWRGGAVPGGLISRIRYPIVFATHKQKVQFRDMFIKSHTTATFLAGGNTDHFDDGVQCLKDGNPLVIAQGTHSAADVLASSILLYQFLERWDGELIDQPAKLKQHGGGDERDHAGEDKLENYITLFADEEVYGMMAGDGRTTEAVRDHAYIDKFASANIGHQASGIIEVTVSLSGTEPLGLTIVGPVDAADARVGIFVTKVAPNSPAKGIIRARSRLYKIDGQDLNGTTRDACAELINAASETVTFVMSEEPDIQGYNEFKSTRQVVPGQGSSKALEDASGKVRVRLADMKLIQQKLINRRNHFDVQSTRNNHDDVVRDALRRVLQAIMPWGTSVRLAKWDDTSAEGRLEQRFQVPMTPEDVQATLERGSFTWLLKHAHIYGHDQALLEKCVNMLLNFPSEYNRDAVVILRADRKPNIEDVQVKLMKGLAAVHSFALGMGGKGDRTRIRHAKNIQARLVDAANSAWSNGIMLQSLLRFLILSTVILAIFHAFILTTGADDIEQKREMIGFSLVLLPLIAGIVGSVYTICNPLKKYTATLAAAMRLEGEIFKYRARCGLYRNTKTTNNEIICEVFSERCKKIWAQCNDANLLEGTCCRSNGLEARRDWEDLSDADTHDSLQSQPVLLDATRYVSLRLKAKLHDLRATATPRSTMHRVAQVAALMMVAASTALASFDESAWIPALLAIACIIEFFDAVVFRLEDQVSAMTATGDQLTQLLFWWDGLSPVKQCLSTNKDKLVEHTEIVLMAQYQGSSATHMLDLAHEHNSREISIEML